MPTLTTAKYIYPPRPMSGSLPVEKIHIYEGYGWKYQPKFNDNHLCISKNGDDVRFFTRHAKEFTRTKYDFEVSPLINEVNEVFEKLGLTEGIQYLDGGLLHSKHQYFKNTIVIWDILVRDNEHLVGTTYKERYEWLLSKLDGEPYYIELNGEKFQVGIKITDNIFIPIMLDDPMEVWDLTNNVNEAANWESGEPLLEGVMCKSPSGVLKSGRREKNNSDWLARCRVTTGRHKF